MWSLAERSRLRHPPDTAVGGHQLGVVTVGPVQAATAAELEELEELEEEAAEEVEEEEEEDAIIDFA